MSATVAVALKKVAIYILGDEKKRGKLFVLIGSIAAGFLGLMCLPVAVLSSMGSLEIWFCQYHLTHFIRTRIMQRERYDHSRAFFELPEAAHRWRCRFFC